jgi:hypothetical protein
VCVSSFITSAPNSTALSPPLMTSCALAIATEITMLHWVLVGDPHWGERVVQAGRPVTSATRRR